MLGIPPASRIIDRRPERPACSDRARRIHAGTGQSGARTSRRFAGALAGVYTSRMVERTWRSRYRELQALVNEVAEVDWRRPAWPVLTGVAALLEGGAGRPGESSLARYLSASGRPTDDTFMGRRRMPPGGAVERAVHAVSCARAAIDTLAGLDGSFPEQPLRVCLRDGSGGVRRQLLDGRGGRRVVFLGPHGAFVAALSQDPAGDAALAVALLAGMGGPGTGLQRLQRDTGEPCAAAVAVSLCEQEVATARHLHRQAWTGGGGPWLGIGATAELQVVTTCHLVVDGYGHARITAELFRRLDERLRRDGDRLRAACARAGVPALAPRALASAAPVAVEPLGVAHAVLPGAPPGFSAMAYALGRTLVRWYGLRGGFSPAFHVPVAPGTRDAPERWRRRVTPALFSLRAPGGAVESFAAFRARAHAVLERERREQGLLSRLVTATGRLPGRAPRKRLLVAAGARASRWLSPVEVLAGRGCLSVLRFPDGELPAESLVAVSSPALICAPGQDDPGGTVLTIVGHRGGVTATVSGNGLAGSAAGARHFLDDWRAELEQLRGDGLAAPAREERDVPCVTARS